MRIFAALMFLMLVSPVTHAQSASVESELTQLLHDFMAGASRNDPAMHNRFWAEDLIYTSSTGERFGKARIMAGFNTETLDAMAEAVAPAQPSTIYIAEEIQILVHNDMAVVAFRMTGTTETDAGTEYAYFLNSGTFLNRNNEWRVVNWQATRIPE